MAALRSLPDARRAHPSSYRASYPGRTSVMRVHMQDRMTIRSLAASADTMHFMAQRLVAEGIERRKTTRLHPLLNADQEYARLRWVLSWLQEARKGGFGFVDMNNVVHVDEKWFNEDSDRKSYYVLEDEEPPHRMQRSKRFIGKIMFLAGVARPRYDFHRWAEFNGKIGIWPFPTGCCRAAIE